MANIATENSDYVIFTSDNPRYEDPKDIINDMITGLDKNNYEIEINPKIYNNKEYIIKGAIRNFEYFLDSSLNVRNQWVERMTRYKLELEKLNKFTDITYGLFIACVILDTYKRCGVLDFNLFSKAEFK